MHGRPMVNLDEPLPVGRRIAHGPAASLAAVPVALQNPRSLLGSQSFVRWQRLQRLQHVFARPKICPIDVRGDYVAVLRPELPHPTSDLVNVRDVTQIVHRYGLAHALAKQRKDPIARAVLGVPSDPVHHAPPPSGFSIRLG